MKHILIIVIILSVYSCSGTYSKFRLTGTPFTAFPDNKEIRIVDESDTNTYEEIGIAEIKNPDKDTRIEEARRLARANGGEVIMPVEEDDRELSDPDVENFRILSPVQNMGENITEDEIIAEEDIEEEIIEEEPAPVKVKPDYSKLQVVPYKILEGEMASLKGMNFRDSMYPGRIVNTPADLSPYTGKNSKLIELKKEPRGRAVYLVTGNKDIKYVQRIIKSKKKLRFVYTPLVVSKNGIPVIRLVDVIE